MKNTTKAGIALSVLSLAIASIILPKTILAGQSDNAQKAEWKGKQGMFNDVRHSKGQKPGMLMREDMLQRHAEILNISADDLKEKMKSGKSFDDVISEAGLTKEAFMEKMKAERKENLDKLVSEGKISPEQAEKMLEMTGKRMGKQGKHRGLHPMAHFDVR